MYNLVYRVKLNFPLGRRGLILQKSQRERTGGTITLSAMEVFISSACSLSIMFRGLLSLTNHWLLGQGQSQVRQSLEKQSWATCRGLPSSWALSNPPVSSRPNPLHFLNPKYAIFNYGVGEGEGYLQQKPRRTGHKGRAGFGEYNGPFCCQKC